MDCSVNSQFADDIDTTLYVNDNVINLGYIESDQKNVRTFSFEITNLSDSTLVINKVDVSCNCVEIINYPHSLNPAQKGRIFGRINLENQIGYMRKSIFVNYNNGRIKMLKITANIKK